MIRPECPSAKPTAYRNSRPLNRAARTMFGNTDAVISASEAVAAWILALQIRRKTPGRMARLFPTRLYLRSIGAERTSYAGNYMGGNGVE